MATWLLAVVGAGGACLLCALIGLALLARDARCGRQDPQGSTLRAPPPFPVDMVITWVDRSDPAWVARYEAVYREMAEADSSRMFRHNPPQEGPADDRETELYFVVRLALRNIPWLRRIVLFTQRPQQPSWVSEFAKVEVVHHDAVFPTPTYNGMVTTASVGDIPDLAEHYIQMDDDVFILEPLSPAYFFDAEGRPVLRPRRNPAWPLPEKQALPYRSIKNRTLRMLCSHVGWRIYSHHCDHQPAPCTRSLVRAAKKSIPESSWGQLARIRCRTDFDFYGVYLVEYLLRKHRGAVRVGANRAAFVEGPDFTAAAAQNTPVLCVNNVFTAAVREYMEQKLNEVGG